MASQDTYNLDTVNSCKACIFYHDAKVEAHVGVRHDPSSGLANTNQRPAFDKVHFTLASDHKEGCLYDVRKRQMRTLSWTKSTTAILMTSGYLKPASSWSARDVSANLLGMR